MQILKLLFKNYLLMALIFLLGRALLFVVYFDNFKAIDDNYWLTFLYGLRMDTMAASMLLVIPTLLLTLAPRLLGGVVEIVLKGYFAVVFAVLIYIENATLPFFIQYDVRPNYLFVEYLEYPKEVFGMIIADYKLAHAIAFAMIGLFLYFYLRSSRSDVSRVFEIPYLKRALLVLPLAALLFLGIRSSFGHRPANISDAMYSTNRTLNEITKNSPYSIGYAIYVNRKHGSRKLVEQYGKMKIGEAQKRVEKRLNIRSLDPAFPLRRLEKSHFPAQEPKNLVIFLQESLGAQFVEATGGEPGITPNLNRLSREGILFADLYSNGTRSVRGIAGSVAGNFSVPGKGVVKRNKSQRDYFTIAKLLKPLGYHTSFIYGGESRFDNMRSWFLGNGFDEVIDEPAFENPAFVGTWGVCDEEVINRANAEYRKLHSEHKRFASVIFSTTNHTPFDFPDGKIELIDGVPKKSVKNAIKYADYAIGKFIEQARNEPYYRDTVFVVLADHNVRVYGNDMVPVNMFHIPGLILGGGIEPLRYEALATQPDVLATALDLMGLEFSYPIMGHSIFSDEKSNLSLMQFNTYYALRVDDRVAVLRPGKKALTFRYEKEHLLPAEADPELEKDVLAFVVLLNYLYQEKLYR